jgi:hypothetical protein
MSRHKKPAPRANAGSRTKDDRSAETYAAVAAAAETDFVAFYIAKRFRLALPLARIVALLGSLGRAVP